MTDKLPPPSTQTALPSQTPFVVLHPLAPTHHPPKVETVEEEPYTIKCICNFSDDDGNTIYCDTCDTWQHIDCFYPNNREEALRDEFSHSCAECNPRPLDRERAIERTRQLKHVTLEAEAPDKKPRRPPTKSHKKKPKPSELQINGNHTGQDNPGKQHASSNDNQPPTKKAKTTHRSSHSINSQTPKHSPPHVAPRNPSTQPLSPAATPPDLPDSFQIHTYSPAFCSMYDDPRFQIVRNNSFSSLAVSNSMSLWLRDSERLKQETGRTYGEVFEALRPDFLKQQMPALAVGDKYIRVEQGRTLHWRYIRTDSAVEKDGLLSELSGEIGFQLDYCRDPANLWSDFTSPLPFVFFHPSLPLYIDTRKEGSMVRYVRRSCKPNAQLLTYILDGSEYLFYLAADRPIAAGEEVTLPWDFRLPKQVEARWLNFLGLGEGDFNGQGEPEMSDPDYTTISEWVYRVLSEYGGCACDLGSSCAFALFHRQFLYNKSQAKPPPGKKKSRKPKNSAVSPTSTGQATNSRAPSENRLDESHESTSDIRSKPPSRDVTPARQGSFDQLGILTELTKRERRKLATEEDRFRRMEQQPPPPAKRKKRISDGPSNPSTKSKISHKMSDGSTTVNGDGVAHYADAGTSGRKSASPAAAASLTGRDDTPDQTVDRSRSVSVKQNIIYSDSSAQTDMVDGEWFSPARSPPRPRRRFVPLSMRLLNNAKQNRQAEERRRRESCPSEHLPDTPSMDVDSAKSVVSAHSPILTDQSSPTVSQALAEGVLVPDVSMTTDVPTTTDVPIATDVPMTIDVPMSDLASTDLISTPPTAAAIAGAVGDITGAADTIGAADTAGAVVTTDHAGPTGAANGTVTSSASNTTSVSGTVSAVSASSAIGGLNRPRISDLQVQLPPVPMFDQVSPMVTSSTTPQSAQSHSPFTAINGLPSPFAAPSVNGLATNPSPIKKKLSLSDYTKSRKAKLGGVATGVQKSIPGAGDPSSAADAAAESTGLKKSPGAPI